MITDFYHVAMAVSNMEEALKFYRDILGMRVVRDRKLSGHVLRVMDGVPDSAVRAVNLSYGGTAEIQLMEWERKGRPMRPDALQNDLGLAHGAFYVKDIEKTYEDFKAKGVKFHCPIQVSGSTLKSVSFEGPDGVRLEMLELGPDWQKAAFEPFHAPEPPAGGKP